MILGVMACGVGTLFVAPYIQATYAELYEVLKYKAITIGADWCGRTGADQTDYTGEREPGYYPYYAAPGGTQAQRTEPF